MDRGCRNLNITELPLDGNAIEEVFKVFTFSREDVDYLLNYFAGRRKKLILAN